MFRWRFLLPLVLGLIVSVFVGLRVQAARLEALSVRLTRQTTATSTDVAIAFTAPTGIDNASDEIEITFPYGFDISALTIADARLTYGAVTGEENTTVLAASAAAGVWGITFPGNNVRLDPPTDAGVGTVPAGDRLVLRIGSWAGGASSVVTPTTTGVFAFSVYGGFGDTGTGYALIRASDGVPVSVVVPASTPPGGGGGGSPPVGGSSGSTETRDATVPIISNLRAEAITSSSAMIRWTTNEGADAYLEYGPTEFRYTLGSRSRAERLTSHEFLLEGLTAETRYHLRVRARDAAGNEAWSSNYSFETSPATPTLEPAAPLTILSVEVAYVDDQQVVIRWTTNHESYGEVRVGVDADMRTAASTVLSRTHVATVTGLTPSTFYPFVVIATTPESERVTANGPGFLTSGDVTPPPNVANFRGVADSISRTVVLTWQNPTVADFQSVTITRLSGGAAEEFVCTTTAGSCTDRLASSVTSVIYRAVAKDRAGNRSSGALTTVSFTSAPTLSPDADSVLEPEPGTTPDSTITPPLGTTPTTSVTTGTDTETVLPPILTPGSGTATGAASTTAPRAPETASSTLPIDVPGSSEAAVTDFEVTPEFFLSSEVIASPDASGVRSALSGRVFQIRLPVVGVGASLRQAQVQLSNGSMYQFAYREALGAFASDFTFDLVQGEDQFVQIQAVSADGRRWEGRFPIRVLAQARVTDVSEDARSLPVAQATVEILLLESDTVVRRLETDEAGRYAEIIPNGQYRLRVQKEGFRSYEQEVRVETGVLAQNVQLRRGLRSLAEIIQPGASLGENAQALFTEALLAADIGLEVIRAPEVQAVTREVVAPAVVIATVGVTATAVTGFNLLNYLHFLFTQPLMLIRRRKRQSWGVVYNALSKQPIELAIVRLLKAGTTFALQTRITDAQGRFSFFVQPGSYTIQILKPGFQFPTTYLKDARMDVDLVDLYHGEVIKVTEPVTISPNIPVDPQVKEETPKTIVRRRQWRAVQSALGVGGIFMSLGAIVISPTLPMVGFAVFQVATYALFRRLAIPPAPKRWGIVYDTDGKRPLAKAVVRIFDKKFNKLLETQITTQDGTYGFFAAKGLYYLTAEKPGYERYLSADLDLTQAKDTYIDHRFTLKPAGTGAK